ncbi:MAG: vWA domain-containing protein [Nitrospirales bacterium]
MTHVCSMIKNLFCSKDFNALRNERGMFAMTTALSLVAMFGFIALGIEVGRWYIVRAELSKAVDAGSLLGARNISNPYLDDYFGVGAGEGLNELVKAIGEANFSPGYFGADTPVIAMTGQVVDGKVLVSGDTNVANYAARTLETASTAGQYATTHVASLGGAQKRDVEIMLVLDRSGSMSQEIGDLRTAAKSFVDYFEDTQDQDKLGLISYSTAVKVDEPLSHGFVDTMKTKIDLMTASGWTNMEDAIDQTDGSSGFTDQSNIPGDQRVQQFLVFFTDGKPTAFRSTYEPNTAPYRLFTRGSINKVNVTTGEPDVVVAASSDSSARLYDPYNGGQLPDISGSYAKQYATGDGLHSSSSACGIWTMKWWILQDPNYGKDYSGSPLSGYGAEHCSIPISKMVDYVEDQAKQMALDHAQEIKDSGVKVYTIGLGSSLDEQLLMDMSSGEAFYHLAPTSAQLQELFQKIAKNIKLRLIQV